MDDFLSRVNSAEPDAGNWAALEGRMRETLANPTQTALQRAEAAAQPIPSVRAVPSPSGTSGLWVGGIATGLVVAGAVVFGLRGTSPRTEAETAVASERQVKLPLSDAIEPAVNSAARGATNGVAVQANDLQQAAQPPTAVAQSTSAVRVSATSTSVRRLRQSDEVATRAAPTHAVAPASERRAAEPAAAIAVQAPLGESDVEYDRRHLVPIDAALQAHQPQTALQLLAEFHPKKLTNYAAGLRAIALCDAGQRVQGKALGERTLPQLGHRGLVRRIADSCGVKAPSEPKP